MGIKSVSTSTVFTIRRTTQSTHNHKGTCTGTNKEFDLVHVRLTTVEVHSSADATCGAAEIRTDGTLRSCACNAGFTGDGYTCTDIDKCASLDPVTVLAPAPNEYVYY